MQPAAERPALTLFDRDAQPVAEIGAWTSEPGLAAAASAVGAFAFPAGRRNAAASLELAPCTDTFHATGTGPALLELYSGPPRLSRRSPFGRRRAHLGSSIPSSPVTSHPSYSAPEPPCRRRNTSAGATSGRGNLPSTPATGARPNSAAR